MAPMGLLDHHQKPVRALCGVDQTLWSCGEDKILCVWDIQVCFFVMGAVLTVVIAHGVNQNIEFGVYGLQFTTSRPSSVVWRRKRYLCMEYPHLLTRKGVIATQYYC